VSAAHPGVRFRFPLRRRRLVALTLDDAPGEMTPDLLALLAVRAASHATHARARISHAHAHAHAASRQEHDARATFFIIGAAAAAYPERLAAIVAAGHEVGNHMCEDAPSWRLSPSAFAREAAHVESLLATHRQQPTQRRWFRRARTARCWRAARVRACLAVSC
jgi:peptidoglycan/xylan/chitin deacetylase (PgdA/CDA1 family)